MTRYRTEADDVARAVASVDGVTGVRYDLSYEEDDVFDRRIRTL